MAGNIKDMTTGNPRKIIFTFAIPLMIGNIFQQLYTMVDTMVVGKYLGVRALAAVGATDWLNWSVLGIVQGLAQGFAILMAQDFGAKNYEKLKKEIGNSVILSILLSILLVGFSQIITLPILHLMNTPDEIIGTSQLYVRIIFAGIPIVMFYNLLASILRSLGDSKTPLQAMIVASIINIILDVVLVLFCHMGVAGAAAATLIAQLISCLYCLYFIRKIEILDLKKEDYQLETPLCGKLLYLGFPIAFQNAIIAIGGMIVQFVVNGYGVLYIAGFIATNKLYGILEIAAVSYGYACVTYMGQNLGAKRIDRIKNGLKEAIIISFFSSLVISAFMLIFGKNILSWFISGTPSEVAQTLSIAYRYLRIMSICLPLLYILYISRSTIQGLGNTVLPMISGFIELGMRTVIVFTLPLLLGQEGLFFAEVSAWFGADLILVTGCLWEIRKVAKQLGFSK